MMRHSKICVAFLFAVSGCVIGESSEGFDDLNIIGGEVDYGDPSVVAILARSADGTSLCTGTVISPTAVLTAAHCVDPRVIGAGKTFTVLTGTTLTPQSQSFAVASTVFDPAFDVNNLEAGHDIAIVKLAQPAPLKPLPINRGALGATEVRHVGYGFDTHIHHPLIESGAGTKRTLTTTINSSTATLVNSGDAWEQICSGDSGGPMFQTINGVEVVVGVHSYVGVYSDVYRCVGGGTSTRVDAYLAFVDANQ